jgi:salicylate hydroxylase
MLGHASHPTATGDLAYRATFTRTQLLDLHDPCITQLCAERGVTAWFGPQKHCVFYAVRAGEQLNMVLIRPDDLAEGVHTQEGDVNEMRRAFEGWDDV